MVGKSITSGWTAIIIQAAIMIFYGGGLLVSINQNSAHIKSLQEKDTDTRVKVIETKMEFYDRIIGKMDTIQNDITELKTQLRFQQDVNHRTQ